MIPQLVDAWVSTRTHSPLSFYHPRQYLNWRLESGASTNAVIADLTEAWAANNRDARRPGTSSELTFTASNPGI